MVIHTFGNPGDPAVVLIHPMLFSGQRMIDLLGKRIPGSHYIIAPDQGGHGEDHGPFTPKEDAAELKRFLLEKGITEVEALYAASMGGIMAMQLLSVGGIHYKTVRMEGIPLARVGGIKEPLAVLSLLMARQKAIKDPAPMAAKLAPFCGEEISNSMVNQMSKLSRANVARIQKACVTGSAVPLEQGVCGRMTFEWGEKEVNVRKGKPLAEQMYPWAEIVVLPGVGHCSRLVKEPEKVAEDLIR